MARNVIFGAQHFSLKNSSPVFKRTRTQNPLGLFVCWVLGTSWSSLPTGPPPPPSGLQFKQCPDRLQARTKPVRHRNARATPRTGLPAVAPPLCSGCLTTEAATRAWRSQGCEGMPRKSSCRCGLTPPSPGFTFFSFGAMLFGAELSFFSAFATIFWGDAHAWVSEGRPPPPPPPRWRGPILAHRRAGSAGGQGQAKPPPIPLPVL